MRKFQAIITETVEHRFDVEAENEIQACNRAEEMFLGDALPARFELNVTDRDINVVPQ